MAEIPSDGFWDGHGFDDTCPWERDDWSPIDSMKLRIDRSGIEDEQQAYRELIEFLGQRHETPLRELHPGEALDLGTTPIGTILRYSYDFQDNNDEEPTLVRDEWGIMAQELKSGDIVLLGTERVDLQEEFDTDTFSRFYDSQPLVVGEVMHNRMKSRWRKDQDLSRFNAIEVWRDGRNRTMQAPTISSPTISPKSTQLLW